MLGFNSDVDVLSIRLPTSGLLHAEPDRLCRCGCGNLHGAAFIVRDQESEEFQLLTLFRAGFRIGNHELLEALQHRGMVIGILDQFHDGDWVRGSGKLPFRIFGMRADFLDEKNSMVIADEHDQPVIVSADVKNHAVAGKEIRRRVAVFDLLRSFSFALPSSKIQQ